MTSPVVNMPMKFVVIAAVALLCSSQVAVSQALAPTSTVLAAPQLKAMVTALDQFRAEGNMVDDYYVSITTDEHGIEVYFVPELVRSTTRPGLEKSKKRDVMYRLNPTGDKVLKVLFGQ